MKNISKKLLSAVLSVSMIVGTTAINFPVVASASDEMTITVSLEGLTLGQGMYVEPETYTLSEINNILAEYNYSSDYTEDNITASVAFGAAMLDNGIVLNPEDFESSSYYLRKIKDVDKGYVNIPQVIYDKGNLTESDIESNADEYLGEFDYYSMSGWMITVNDLLTPVGMGSWNLKQDYSGYNDYDNNYVIRVQFTVSGWGADLGIDTGWGAPAYFEHANKDKLYMKYAQLAKDGAFENNGSALKAKALSVMEKLDATQQEVDDTLKLLENYELNTVIYDTLDKLANTVTEPTYNNEWSVISLARGGYLDKNSEYFKGYYNRLAEEVNSKASSVDKNGALNKNKYTENSRVTIALSSIGKNAHSVGDWDILAPLEDFDAVTKQGLNGPVFALIALDSNNYKTTDSTIRQQYIDYILDAELDGGGWTFFGSADPDMTGMTIQALSRYMDNADVKSAVERGINKLSEMQNDDGGYASWGSVNSESISQVIVACTSVGIDPNTDSRFVKNGKSAVDALLGFYDSSSTTFTFRHVMDGAVNGMATDQASYALVAYQRFINNKNSLYNMSDADVEGVAQFGGATVSLKGNIGVNFHMLLDDEIANDKEAYMQFNLADGKSSTVKMKDAQTTVIDGVTYYVFPLEIPAKDMSENITSQMFLGDGTKCSAVQKYSVSEYADKILNGSYDDKAKAVVKAMVNYGECAEAYFNPSVSTTVDTDSVTSETLADFMMSSSGNLPKGIEYYGSSLLLESQTTLRHYFKVADGTEVSAYNFSGNKDNYYYIDISDISSLKLNKANQTTIGEYTISYSPLSYAYAVVNNENATDSLKALVKALYLYNQASVAYNGGV